jgi:hypothetical protein
MSKSMERRIAEQVKAEVTLAARIAFAEEIIAKDKRGEFVPGSIYYDEIRRMAREVPE